MRWFKAFTFISTLCTCAEAATPLEGIYVGGIFGGTYQHNVHKTANTSTILNDFSIPSSALPTLPANKNVNVTLGYQMLVNGGGQIGVRFCDNFRLELEGLFNKNPYNFLNIGDVTIYNNSSETTGFRLDGSTSSGLGIVNAYYDFLGDGSNNLVPYIGGGGGFAYIYDVGKLFYNGELVTPNQQSIKTNSTTFVGQAIIGASYFMDDFFSIAVDLRYYVSPVQKLSTSINTLQNIQLQVYSFNMLFNGVLELG